MQMATCEQSKTRSLLSFCRSTYLTRCFHLDSADFSSGAMLVTGHPSLMRGASANRSTYERRYSTYWGREMWSGAERGNRWSEKVVNCFDETSSAFSYDR